MSTKSPAQIGSGGMGEVYKGRDTRLDRTVAIKVLPDVLAADPQFRDRFDREARTLSKLTHPNICTVHDVGEQGGSAFLVMELLEGETLEARCARASSKGSGLPVDEALRIAIQMADALTAAHRQGIVHRDLKPGNIFLVRSPGVSAPPVAKLLDFGLARTTPAVTVTSATLTPTSPPQAITAQGSILGTFQYMAPEQVEGGEADARTDIFAFGTVLYEMLTGKRPFEGKTQASLVAAILEREPPPLPTVQPLTPSLVNSIVRKCLAKNPDDRWQTAADLGSALRWAADSANPSTSSVAAAAAIPPGRTRRALRGALVAAGLLAALAVGVAVGGRYLPEDAPTAATVRFDVPPPEDVTLTPAPVASAAQLALSPDGRRLAFVAAKGHGVSQLWVRALDRTEAQPLPGTDGASFPFWSPDGRSLAFFAAGKLRKIDTTGGGAADGAATPPGMYRSLRLSPDQKSVAMSVTEPGGNPDIWVLDLARRALSRATSDPGTDWFPVWRPGSGRLFFGANRFGSTTVFEKTLGATEVLFVESAQFSGTTTYPLDVSRDERSLVFQTGSSRGYDLGVLALAGERKASMFLTSPFNEVQGRFSPNGRWMAYASDESGRFEIYVRPFPAASGQTQISIAGGMQPEWRGDGKELFYVSADGRLTAVPVTTDGETFSAGTPQALFDVEIPEATAPYPGDYAVTADGRRFFVNTVVEQPTRPALTVILNWRPPTTP